MIFSFSRSYLYSLLPNKKFTADYFWKVILLFKKGELALIDRYKAASDLISLIAAKSLSKSSIPKFICTLEVAIEVP